MDTNEEKWEVQEAGGERAPLPLDSTRRLSLYWVKVREGTIKGEGYMKRKAEALVTLKKNGEKTLNEDVSNRKEKTGRNFH